MRAPEQGCLCAAGRETFMSGYYDCSEEDEGDFQLFEGEASPTDRKDEFAALKIATQTLPRLTFNEAVSSRTRRLIKQDRTFSMLVTVPSKDWVEPIKKYLCTYTKSNCIIGKTKLDRSSLDANLDAAALIAALTTGNRFIAVSVDPEYLPAPISQSADFNISVANPSNKVIARAIRLATGKRVPKLPNNIAEGLGYTGIVTAIRLGSTPRQCIDRLQKAARRNHNSKIEITTAPPIEDLHGYGAAKDWAMNLLADLKLWRAGKITFDAMERHAVLASAPGLGKTTFARSLARSVGLPLVTTSVAEWFADSSGHLDSVIKQIDDVFRTAAASAPAVLFMDEIDALPDRRSLGNRNRDWWMPVINHMLAKLDGTISGDIGKLIILAATNHPDRLDPALLRPGRLSRIIHIGHPSAKDLEGIFRHHLGEDLTQTDLSLLSQLAFGSTGADVMGFVKAARRAARQAERPLQLDDLMAVVAPPEKRSQGEIERVAVHEAAHAVVSYVQGQGNIHAISIIKRADLGGYTVRNLGHAASRSQSELEADVRVDLAGYSAEIVFYGEASSGAGGRLGSDLALATHRTAMLYGAYGFGNELSFRFGYHSPDEALATDPALRRAVNKHLQKLQTETIHIVKRNRTLIEKVAHELAARRYLNARQFEILIRGHREPKETAYQEAEALNE